MTELAMNQRQYEAYICLKTLATMNELITQSSGAADREVSFLGKHAQARVFGDGERPSRKLALLLRGVRLRMVVAVLNIDTG